MLLLYAHDASTTGDYSRAVGARQMLAENCTSTLELLSMARKDLMGYIPTIYLWQPNCGR